MRGALTFTHGLNLDQVVEVGPRPHVRVVAELERRVTVSVTGGNVKRTVVVHRMGFDPRGAVIERDERLYAQARRALLIENPSPELLATAKSSRNRARLVRLQRQGALANAKKGERTVERVRALVAKRQTHLQIAHALGLSRGRVSNICSMFGIRAFVESEKFTSQTSSPSPLPSFPCD